MEAFMAAAYMASLRLPYSCVGGGAMDVEDDTEFFLTETPI